MSFILIKILTIIAFSGAIIIAYKREYGRGYADGVAESNTTTLPHGCVRVVLELPPHLHSKLIAHLTQFELTDYVSDEFNFIIKQEDVKIFADFAYKHSLGISIKNQNA